MAGHDPIKTAEQLIGAFSASDWEQFKTMLADDITYAEAGTGRRVHGVESYLEVAKGWKQAFPDAFGTIDNAIATGSTVAQAITWTGTHAGPLQWPGGTVPASGQQVTVVASVWYHFEDNKIKEIQHHLDVISLLTQIGAFSTSTAS
jgi:steroid delta-isomerase-like uncharacterized protein